MPSLLHDSIGIEVPWTAFDSSELRKFLHEHATGRRVIARLLVRRPMCSERENPIKRSIQSGIAEGFDEALRELVRLTDSTKSVTEGK